MMSDRPMGLYQLALIMKNPEKDLFGVQACRLTTAKNRPPMGRGEYMNKTNAIIECNCKHEMFYRIDLFST